MAFNVGCLGLVILGLVAHGALAAAPADVPVDALLQVFQEKVRICSVIPKMVCVCVMLEAWSVN